MLNENVSTGNARRAKFGGIKQRVSSSEVISNTQKQDQIVKHYADHASKKKAAGDAAHAAASKAGKSPMEAETARNRAHREYEKAQKKARLNSSYIPSFAEYIEEAAGGALQSPAYHNTKRDASSLPTIGFNHGEVVDGKKPKKLPKGKVQKEPTMEGAAWTKKEGQNEKGGLNEKGRKSYEAENPGSDLKAPSKKVGNPRRASFCARMKGMRKRQKPSNNTGDDRLSKSLRAWNC